MASKTIQKHLNGDRNISLKTYRYICKSINYLNVDLEEIRTLDKTP